MQELINFEQFVRENLNDRTAARSLVDFREELLGVPHVVALRAVAAIRRQQRNAVELAEAARCIKVGTKWSPLLRLHIRHAAGELTATHSTIVLVAGSRPPKQTACNPLSQGWIANGRAVTVGARWVIRRAAELRVDMHEVDDTIPSIGHMAQG